MIKKLAYVTLAYFHQRLLYFLCLHYRTTINQVSRKRCTIKNQKNLGNLYISWKERDLLLVHVNGDTQGSETLHIPKNHLQPSIKLVKIGLLLSERHK